MNLEEGIQKQMERAFWDIATEAISRNDFQGFNSAVDDLKTSVKKLVPSRDDLHRTIEEFTPAADSAPVARSNLLKVRLCRNLYLFFVRQSNKTKSTLVADWLFAEQA